MGKTLKVALIPGLLAAGFAGAAGAAGFQLLEQNASGIGNAYAGSAAVADNASTIFFNPAGMTRLQAREISGGLSAVQTSFKFRNDGSSTGALAGNGGEGGTLGFIPNGYLSWAIAKDLYLGIGVGAPFGLKTEYDNPWAGGAHSLSFDIKTVNINPAIAYRVNEKLALGFGLNWQRMDAEYKKLAGIATVPVPGLGAGARPLNASVVTLKADDDAWGWNAGALFTLSPATRIGVSYRSAIRYDLSGSLKSDGPDPVLNAATGSDAKADLKVPDTFVLSVFHSLDERWDLLADVSWTGWSSIPKVDIQRTSGAQSGTTALTLDTRFRDTWRVALGANYKYNDAWKLKFGLAYDQTPIRDAEHRLTSLPDNNRTWFSLGAQWKPNRASTLDVGLAYLYVKAAPIDNGGTSAAQGRVTGKYDDSAWILGAQYSLSF